MTRTYWLSFCDPGKPKGQQFIGATIVDVSDADAAAALVEVRARFPHAEPGAEWIAAAMRVARDAGCNPGGEMLSGDVTDVPELANAPRNRLMQFPELRALGLISAVH